MDFDVAVIGAGPGGYVAAAKASQLGGKVCLIEKGALGGTCLNRGCIPSKVLLHAAKLYSSIGNSHEFGITVSDAKFDYSNLAQRIDVIVGRLNKGISALMKARKVSLIQGTALLSRKREITVTDESGERVITATKIILATGSESARPAIFPFDGKQIITSEDVFQWKSLPNRLLIVGAGPTGCELASAMQDLGAEVYLVESLGQLLPGQDQDVARELTRAFKQKGIQVRTKTRIDSISVNEGKVLAQIADESLTIDSALICTGRKLNTDHLGLEALGIELENKAVVINEHCQTSQANIYAIGDMTGKAMLAHVASHQARVAAKHAMGFESVMEYDNVPGCVYSDPEVAFVGLTESQAKERGRKVKASKFLFKQLGKSQVVNELKGFLKIVADKETGEIMGVHIVGAHATELISEATLAIRLEATVEELSETIHAHPTLSEAYLEAAEMYLEHRDS